MQTIWGVDLGGTKIEGIVLRADNNEILARLRVPTEGSLGFEHVVGQVKKLINLLKTETKLEPKAIGFSTPGTIDPSTQTMKNSNIVALNGKLFKKAIETALGIPTEMANDANCFALAEANFGSVQDVMPDAKVVFGAILGTGVGGGVVVNGQIINGRHGIGGEWGHNQFDAGGSACYCGKSGCNEQIFAGPALQKFYEARTGTFKPMQEIYQLHQSGTDQDATDTIRFLIESFGKAVHQIINVLDPDCIVLGGGLSHIEELYTESQAEISKYIFNSRKVETLILKPKLGDSAGIFGAIELVRGYN